MWETGRGNESLPEKFAGLANDCGFKRLHMNSLSSLIFCAPFFTGFQYLGGSIWHVGQPFGGGSKKPSPYRVREMVEEIRLLKKKEFQELFPDCEILTEKMWGILPKSYIAVRQA
jgi:hypothetical protein